MEGDGASVLNLSKSFMLSLSSDSSSCSSFPAQKGEGCEYSSASAAKAEEGEN